MDSDTQMKDTDSLGLRERENVGVEGRERVRADRVRTGMRPRELAIVLAEATITTT